MLESMSSNFDHERLDPIVGRHAQGARQQLCARREIGRTRRDGSARIAIPERHMVAQPIGLGDGIMGRVPAWLRQQECTGILMQTEPGETERGHARHRG